MPNSKDNKQVLLDSLLAKGDLTRREAELFAQAGPGGGQVSGPLRLLVTGGAGFIGSNFVKYILHNYPDHRVVNYDALTYAGNLENLSDVENNPNYAFVKGDIQNEELLNKVIADENIDVIVNFAAESHVDRSIMDPDAFLRSNILGTHSILRVARRNGNIRVHHVSTDEVYGSLDDTDPPFDEDSPYDPRSPYSASKAASDHITRAYFHTYDLPVTISNCTNNYGPFMFPEKFIPLFITNLLEGKKVPLYGDGMNVRDWLHVEDHCRAIDTIIRHGRLGETYCIGGDTELTNRSIAYMILDFMGYGEEMLEFIKDRPGHDKRYAMDHTKLTRELGWQPSITFEYGLKAMIEWYKQNRQWWQNIKSGEYQDYYRKQYELR